MDTRFDYVNQAWIENGRYVRCGHPEAMTCDCYGRKHAGELAVPVVPEVVTYLGKQK